MNFFLFCRPQCLLQHKKKIIKIGPVDREIIAKYDSFGPYQIPTFLNLVWSETIVFCDYLAIYWSDFNYLFLCCKGHWGLQNKKKFIEIRSLDLKIMFNKNLMHFLHQLLKVATIFYLVTFLHFFMFFMVKFGHFLIFLMCF